MSERAAAVMVSRSDGTVVLQNAGARTLLGEGGGRSCWKHVGGARGGRGLPCEAGCVAKRVSSRQELIEDHPVSLRGRRYALSCVAVADHVVSLLVERPEDAGPWERLTPREVEVLELLAEGLETAAIAERLGVAQSTVRAHVEHMRARLGVRTRAALVARGFRLHYLS